ncbi:MAG: ATPase domain-containing protein [Deltaproteobacteria bacterium]|nr:ATPase domain-containing protein [Deltaproteobacteria bacterium]
MTSNSPTRAKRLERLEETPEQLRAISQAVGWDIEEFEDNGLLSIQYTSPVELSTDRFLEEARRAIKRIGAKRVVFDSLTSMSFLELRGVLTGRPQARGEGR